MLLFEGLKVLDVGTWVAGPVAATILADFGADVIKVEMPGRGDPFRYLPRTQNTPGVEVNYTWIMDGRNKRSITLDLKSAEGQEVLRKLIPECDVYLTNQPMGVRRRMKLTYEDIGPLNDRMVYASLTAYGERGPEAEKTGFDGIAYWVRSGLSDMVRSPGGGPSQSIAGMGDHPTCVAMFACIMMGLYKRQITGKGGAVSTSLLANGFWSASCLGQAAIAGADFSARRKATRVERTWIRHQYPASDERLMVLSMIRTPGQQEEFLEVIGLGDLLADERFADQESRMRNSAALRDQIAAVMSTRDSNEWLRFFIERGINVSRLAILEDMGTDEQAIVNGVLATPREDVGVPYVINAPVFVDGVTRVGPKRAPEVGEHTDEVLSELGYDTGTISAWRDAGKI